MSPKRVFFNVLTSDLSRARDFYVELLGYGETFVSDWFVSLAAADPAGGELGLLRADGEVVPDAGRERPVGGMLTLVVDDVDALHARAQHMQVTIVEPPRNLFYGQRRMLLRDPDGTLLDVSSPCDPDPAWAARLSRREDGAYVEA